MRSVGGSWLPSDYLNDASLAAYGVSEGINGDGRYYCAYTFDAGLDSIIYCLEDAEAKVESPLRNLLAWIEIAL